MPTIAQLETRIARDLGIKDRGTLTLVTIRDAIQAAPQNEKDMFVAAAQVFDRKRFGELGIKMIRDYLASQALPEAQAMLADNALSKPELDRWLD